MAFDDTTRREMDAGNTNTLGSCASKAKLGTFMTQVKVVAAGLTAAASFDITTAAFKALSTINGIDLNTGENLPAMGRVLTLRVTASGTANSVGSYGLTDTGGTAVSPTAGANMGIAKISDDGKTLTFLTTVTAFTLYYFPVAGTAMNTLFPTAG
jgi:hypothetical protein